MKRPRLTRLRWAVMLAALLAAALALGACGDPGDVAASAEPMPAPAASATPVAVQEFRGLLPIVITNEDGFWDTPSGPVQVRGPGPRFEHFVYSTSTGSGAYAGLMIDEAE